MRHELEDLRDTLKYFLLCSDEGSMILATNVYTPFVKIGDIRRTLNDLEKGLEILEKHIESLKCSKSPTNVSYDTNICGNEC